MENVEKEDWMTHSNQSAVWGNGGKQESKVTVPGLRGLGDFKSKTSNSICKQEDHSFKGLELMCTQGICLAPVGMSTSPGGKTIEQPQIWELVIRAHS